MYEGEGTQQEDDEYLGSGIVVYGVDSTPSPCDAEESAALAEYIRRSDPHDWNARFQQLIAGLQHSSGGEEHHKQRSRALRELAREFASASVAVCTRIVEELFLPNEQKTVPSIITTGVAGGVKYLHDGIFVKMASRDWKRIYGGDAYSIKAASQELVSTMAYLDLRVADLHFPLMALVEWRGHAFLCQSIIPIDPVRATTLVHGSGDAGIMIRNSNSKVQEKLRLCAERLNLEPHEVVSRDRSHYRLLNCAADVEAHVGLDGRIYIIDTARAFPPAAPRKNEPRSGARYLYCHLRPELVKRFRAPLNPDAFSNFRGRDNEYQKRCNALIVECTEWLVKTVIVDFARWLDECLDRRTQIAGPTMSQVDLVDDGSALVSLMHLNGINVRYLLLVLARVKHPDNRANLLAEAISRVLKHSLFEAWRAVQSSDATEYHRVTVRELNRAFGGNGPEVLQFWTQDAPRALKAYFSLPCDDDDDDGDDDDEGNNSGSFVWLGNGTDLRTILGPARCGSSLFRRVLFQCGIEMNPACLELRDASPLVAEDVVTIHPRVKHLSRISFEEALCFSRMAEGAPTREESIRLCNKAVKRYQECLSAKPDDYRAQFNLSMVLFQLARLATNSQDSARAQYTAALEQCRRALRVCEEDWRCAFLYGSSLMEAANSSNGQYTTDERENMLRQAKGQLELAVLQSASLRFEPHYNLGNALLHLARLCTEEEGIALLHRAIQSFRNSLECQPNNAQSLSNLATAQSKLARMCSAPAERERWFQQALHTYVAAASAPQGMTAQIFFDWGNCLFRYGREQPKGSTTSLDCLKQAAFRYGKVVEMSPTFKEAWFNLGVALESLAMDATDDLIPLIEQFFALSSLDAKRADTTRRRLMRSPNVQVVRLCAAGSPIVLVAPSPRSRGANNASPQEGAAPCLSPSPRTGGGGGGSPSSMDSGVEEPALGRLKSNSFLSRAKSSLSKTFHKSSNNSTSAMERGGLLFNWSAVAPSELVWSVGTHADLNVDEDIEYLDVAMSLQKDSGGRLAILGGKRYCVKKVTMDVSGRAAIEAWATISQRCLASPYLSRLGAVWQKEGCIFLLQDFACGGELSLALRVHNSGSPTTLRAYTAQLICAIDTLRKQDKPWRRLFGIHHLLLADAGNLLFSFSLESDSQEGVLPPPDAHSASDDSLVGWSVGVCLLQLGTRHPVRDAAALMQNPVSYIKSKKVQLPREMVDFLVPLLSDWKRREAAVKEWRRSAWFSGLDWARCEAGKMTPSQDGIMEHLDAFDGAVSVAGGGGGGATLVPGATLADIDARTFISPARSTAFRGDTLNNE